MIGHHALTSGWQDTLISLFFPLAGVHYRKSCASSGACLIASSGYQQFCTGRLNSVCITCCNTPLCNGLKKKRPAFSSSPSLFQKLNNSLHFLMTTSLLPMMLLTWTQTIQYMPNFVIVGIEPVLVLCFLSDQTIVEQPSPTFFLVGQYQLRYCGPVIPCHRWRTNTFFKQTLFCYLLPLPDYL